MFHMDPVMNGLPNPTYLEALQQRDLKQLPVFNVPTSEHDCQLDMLNCSSDLSTKSYTRYRKCNNQIKVESDSQGFWLFLNRKILSLLYLSRMLCCRQMEEPEADEEIKVPRRR